MSNLRFFAKQDEFHNEKAYVKKSTSANIIHV